MKIYLEGTLILESNCFSIRKSKMDKKFKFLGNEVIVHNINKVGNEYSIHLKNIESDN